LDKKLAGGGPSAVGPQRACVCYRSEAETQYAKTLNKLSGKLLKASKDSVGTVNQAWQRAGAQMEAQSEIHR
jgi:hypothetical protein